MSEFFGSSFQFAEMIKPTCKSKRSIREISNSRILGASPGIEQDKLVTALLEDKATFPNVRSCLFCFKNQELNNVCKDCPHFLKCDLSHHDAHKECRLLIEDGSIASAEKKHNTTPVLPCTRTVQFSTASKPGPIRWNGKDGPGMTHGTNHIWAGLSRVRQHDARQRGKDFGGALITFRTIVFGASKCIKEIVVFFRTDPAASCRALPDAIPLPFYGKACRGWPLPNPGYRFDEYDETNSRTCRAGKVRFYENKMVSVHL